MASNDYREQAPPQNLPLVVAGAGLAGLSAALHAARAGQRVVLLEQSEQIGGRAITRRESGWHFNLGAHAIYNAGEGRRILAALGVQLIGKAPPVTGVQVFIDGQLHPLLGSWLGLGEKLKWPLLLARVMTLDPKAHRGISATAWLDGLVGGSSSRLRQLMGFLIRVSSYAAAHDKLSAEVAIQQLQLALKANVTYLDGGWQSLLDQLARLARRQGVELRTGAGLKSLKRQGGSWALSLADGSGLDAAGVILAMPPQAVQRLLAPWPGLALHRQLAELEPVLAGTLDIGLTRLPQPGNKGAFGIDEASYFSVHSAGAKLAPAGGALIHAMAYLAEPEDPHQLRARLEARLDAFQPGWQTCLGPSHFYPHLTVTHALAKPGAGLAGRPAVQVAGLPNLLLAGDWVGESGWLADAALASGREAARRMTLRAESQAAVAAGSPA